MVATPIPAELETLFRHIKDLKARISDIASQMPIFHRNVQQEIAQRTGSIPPITSSGPREDVLQTAIELHYQQMRIEELRRQSIVQEALRDVQRQKFAGVDTVLLNPQVVQSQQNADDDDATEIRPVVKPPIPLRWKCKRNRHEQVQQHFARCARLFTEMYDLSPQYIQVSPDDNLTLTLYDVRFPRKEQEDLEEGYMVAIGTL